MTTITLPRATVEQALEAMRFALHVGFDESSESQIKKADKASRQHWSAIRAIEAALAQQAEPVDTDCHTQGICQRSGYGITQQAEPVTSCGWLFRRNADGTIGIFAPPPKPGESQRTSDCVGPNNHDLHELLGKLADHMAALAQQAEPVQDQDVEDAIEAAYWQFDCRKKGLNEWASAPQSERDAFKAEARKLVRGYFPTRQAQDTKREMLAIADAFIRGKRAALAEPTGKDSLQVEPTVAENATTQQQIEQTPPSEYRRGYWDGFNIGKREGRIEAEDELAKQAEPVELVAWLVKWANAYDGEAYTEWQKGYDAARSVVKAHLPVSHTQSHEPQQAEPVEPVAKVELMTTGGNAGLATRIVEIDDHLRERLRPGQLLYTAPPQQTEPVEPYCYVYEYDGAFGLHREFYPLPYNGMKPSRTVPVYTAPPQRKPLTEEEIEFCRQQGYAHGGLSAPFDFGKAARAVERKVRGEER